MSTPDDELSPAEQKEMKRLVQDVLPPHALENRIVHAMRKEGMIRTHRKWLQVLTAVAAGILLFAGGVAAGRYRPAVPEDPRPEFALMLYEDSSYQTASPAELPDRIREYGRWARNLGPQNYVGGEKLAEKESTVSQTGILGPTAPTAKSGSVAGYFIVRASDAAEAAKIAATCPHVRYGGVVSVRELER